MVDLAELKDVAHRISQLLEKLGERDFSASFADFEASTPPVIDETGIGDIARSIRRYMGSVGSFTDLEFTEITFH